MSMFIAALLSIDAVAELFKQRASLRAELRHRRAGPLCPPHPRRAAGARPAARHRAAAVRQVFSRGPAQLVPQRLHVGRLAGRRLLSGAGRDARWCFGLRTVFMRTPWQQTTIVVYRRLCRHRDRKLHHRHRPLAARVPAARRAVGADRGDARLRRARDAPRGRGRPAGPCTPGGPAYTFSRSERSAARLAHQSGGLGVASSNLAAPTIKSLISLSLWLGVSCVASTDRCRGSNVEEVRNEDALDQQYSN